MPSWMGLNFQDSSSPSMSELSIFHDHIIVVMSGIIVLIIYVLTYLMFSTKYYKNLSEGTLIELVWSIVPAFLLIMLVLPSMKVLYFMEDEKSPSLTFKVVAHQWYWTYVVPLFKNVSYKVGGKMYTGYEYDSMMEEGYPRLLLCSEDVKIPVGVSSRFLVSSTDVIHSFAVPSLGMKVDALPGRINQLFVNPSRLGVFYGQCSEICGSNHSFMPIMINVVDGDVYDFFTKEFLLSMVKEDGGGLNF